MAAALPVVGSVPLVAPPGVFKGRELTRKDRRLSAALAPLDALLEGGIPRGRISEIVGRRSCGKTSLAAAFISSATCRGEVAAVIDLANAFDPATMAEAGVELSRVLWVNPGNAGESFLSPPPHSVAGEGEGSDALQVTHQLFQTPAFPNRHRSPSGAVRSFLRAAEMVLEAGGFGLLVMDCGESTFSLAQSSALRLARMAERSGTAVLLLAARPLCGTFAAMSLELTPARTIFSRARFVRPDPKSKSYLKCIRQPHPRPLPQLIAEEGTDKALFEGIEIRATIRRNKLGRCGLSARWRSMVSIAGPALHLQAPKAIRIA
jgi:hypothetical protein